MKRMLIAPIMLALSGCSALQTVGQPLDVGKTYRMELPVTINGKKGLGAMVVPESGSGYQVQARAPSDPDLVVIGSCAREDTIPKADDNFQYSYAPNQLEKDRYCPVHISTLSAKTWYTGAFFDVQRSDTSVPAKVECNGIEIPYVGTMVCQEKAGLWFRVTFANPVDAGVPSRTQCPALTSDDGLKFEFRMPVGECAYKFFLRSDQKQLARLTTVGYEEYVLPPK